MAMTQVENEKIIEQLEILSDAKDLVGYYQLLATTGSKYGNLALGVVNDRGFAGTSARNFAEKIAAENNVILDKQRWLKLSVDLMNFDFAFRKNQVDDGLELELLGKSIREYHNLAFIKNDLPIEAWTAEIPLRLADEKGELEAKWQQTLGIGDNGYLESVVQSRMGERGGNMGNFVLDLQKKALLEKRKIYDGNGDFSQLGTNPGIDPATYYLARLFSPKIVLKMVRNGLLDAVNMSPNALARTL